MRIHVAKVIFALSVSVGAGSAFAQEAPQPVASEPEPAPSDSELSAAPDSDKAHGVVKRRDNSPSLFTSTVPRVIFFVPKWSFFGLMWPIRKGLYLVDRHDVPARIGRLLSGDSALSLFPSAIIVAGQGVTFGFGADYRKYVRGRLLFGGEARQIYGVKLRTRDLLGASFELDAEAEYQRLRNSIFAGIGNSSLQSGEYVGPLLDPVSDDTAFETRYDQNVTRIELGANWSFAEHFEARLSAAYLRRRFDAPDDSSATPLQTIYDTTKVTSFDSGFSQLYSEFRLSFDNRSQPSQWVSAALPTRGWKLTGFGGRTHATDNSHEDYTRLGLNAQRYQHLFGDNRVLIGRAQVEWVSAQARELPFVDLAQLGGSTILRGYRRGRFRDRMSVLGSLEYRFPLNRQLSGFLFVDAGTVARTPSKIDLEDFHLGTGIGLHLHTTDRLLVRMQVAAGEDGIAFNASFRASDRVRRSSKRR